MAFPVIPGYRIERVLGAGGRVTVYLAVQESFGRHVALKVLTDKSFAPRFLRAAKLVASLSHRNIVPVYDVGKINDSYYIAMEYLTGGNLKTRLRDGLSIYAALQILKQVAAGLDYAGRKKLVHRDIKPANILFREDGSPVISNFGIVRHKDSKTNITLSGAVVGTPHYMSPEQAEGAPVDHRSDLYSLGVILYQALTGEVPFTADSPVMIGIKHIAEDPPPLPEYLADAQSMVSKALEKNPDARFQNGVEFIHGLMYIERELRESCGNTLLMAKAPRFASRTSGMTARQRSPDPAGRRPSAPARANVFDQPATGYWMLGLTLVLAVGAAGWWLFWSGDSWRGMYDGDDDQTAPFAPVIDAASAGLTQQAKTAIEQNKQPRKNDALVELQVEPATGISEPVSAAPDVIDQRGSARKQDASEARREHETVLGRQRKPTQVSGDELARYSAPNPHQRQQVIQQKARLQNQLREPVRRGVELEMQVKTLVNEVSKLEGQARTPAANVLLREKCLALLKLQPDMALAVAALNQTSDYEAERARSALLKNDFRQASKHIEVIKSVTPDHRMLATLESALRTKQQVASEVNALLDSVQSIIDSPYKKPGFLGNNDWERARLVDSYTKLTRARKLDEFNQDVLDVFARLEKKYIAIIDLCLDADDIGEASLFLADRNSQDWPVSSDEWLRVKLRLAEQKSRLRPVPRAFGSF